MTHPDSDTPLSAADGSRGGKVKGVMTLGPSFDHPRPVTQQQSNYPPPYTAWVDTLPISITICALVLHFTSQPSLSFAVWLVVPSLLLSVAPCPFYVCLSFSVNVCVCLWDHFWRGGPPIPELELSLPTLTSPCAKNTDLDMHCSGKPDPFGLSGPDLSE